MKSSVKKTKRKSRVAASANVEEFYKHQKMLLPYTGQFIGKTNLDVGCGTGITSVIHRRELGVSPTLCDVQDIRHSSAKTFPFYLMQDGKLPFKAKTFASSYFQYVLHHLASEEQVERLLAEACRVSGSVIIVEEIAGRHTDVLRAKAFDKEMNEQLHPGTSMPVYRYYSKREIERLLKTTGQKLQSHAVVSTGFVGNGFLETHVFYAS